MSKGQKELITNLEKLRLPFCELNLFKMIILFTFWIERFLLDLLLELLIRFYYSTESK